MFPYVYFLLPKQARCLQATKPHILACPITFEHELCTAEGCCYLVGCYYLLLNHSRILSYSYNFIEYRAEIPTIGSQYYGWQCQLYYRYNYIVKVYIFTRSRCKQVLRITVLVRYSQEVQKDLKDWKD